MKNQTMTIEEMRDALIKHPKVLDSLTPLSQVVVRKLFGKDLGKKKRG